MRCSGVGHKNRVLDPIMVLVMMDINWSAFSACKVAICRLLLVIWFCGSWVSSTLRSSLATSSFRFLAFVKVGLLCSPSPLAESIWAMMGSFYELLTTIVRAAVGQGVVVLLLWGEV